jgi:transposase-like protein
MAEKGKRVPDEVRAEIVRLYATGQHTMVELGLRFGLANYSISRIVRKAAGLSKFDKRRLRKGNILGYQPQFCPHCGLYIRENGTTYKPIRTELEKRNELPQAQPQRHDRMQHHGMAGQAPTVDQA